MTDRLSSYHTLLYFLETIFLENFMLKIDSNDKAKLIDPLFVTTPRF
ncbi:MAG: hypothetical protein HZB77_14575 [Chloroflexi bacterium]|nr:hypothetical protein [Chloroflexota bacterium]